MAKEIQVITIEAVWYQIADDEPSREEYRGSTPICEPCRQDPSRECSLPPTACQNSVYYLPF